MSLGGARQVLPGFGNHFELRLFIADSGFCSKVSFGKPHRVKSQTLINAARGLRNLGEGLRDVVEDLDPGN